MKQRYSFSVAVILGINAYHGDASAAIVVDGRLLYAIEEERLRRKKHWAGFPVEAIKRCLEFAGVDIKQVDYIAISRNPKRRILKKFIWTMERGINRDFLKNRMENTARLTGIKGILSKYFNVKNIKAKLIFVEHHTAHMGSTFLVSPFERAAILTMDGFGDFASTVMATGEGKKINVINEVIFPHSMGILYTAFTQFLGFPHYGDEYKVMGLSATGEPTFLEKMRSVVRSDGDVFRLNLQYFTHAKSGVDMTWQDTTPQIGKLFSPYMEKVFGQSREPGGEIQDRHRDIASSLQRRYEEVFYHLLNRLYEKTRIENLALAGGCIQNSVANGKILEKTPFKKIYIPPAAHDAGTAIGAAMFVWNVILKGKRDFIMENPYWGDTFSDKEIEEFLKSKKVKYRKLKEKELIKTAARLISQGKIVGWFQGRTEFGPRALGNRSILVDPRRKEMKDILNSRIKKREPFRPFAPSVPEEFASDWFEIQGESPFMERVFRVRKEKAHLIPAVVHYDGTGRVQTVSKRINPLFHSLLVEFGKITKVPVLLNTSFNENEPIVNTLEDAYNCFRRTGMDILFLGSFLITS